MKFRILVSISLDERSGKFVGFHKSDSRQLFYDVEQAAQNDYGKLQDFLAVLIGNQASDNVLRQHDLVQKPDMDS